jgi:septum site-determining protein MinD
MDNRVIVATNTGTPLILQKNSVAGEAFQRIAKRLNGQYDLPIIVPIPSKSIWKTIGTKFGIRK